MGFISDFIAFTREHNTDNRGYGGFQINRNQEHRDRKDHLDFLVPDDDLIECPVCDNDDYDLDRG